MQKIDTKELVPIKARATKAISYANGLDIKTDADEEKAGLELTNINIIGDNLKEKKTKILSPAEETVKAIKELFKPMEDNVKNAVSVIREKLETYHKKKLAIEATKKASITARVEKGTLKANTAVSKLNEVTVESKIQNKNGSINYKTVRKVRIIDPKKVPAKYFVLNEVLIRQEALAGVKIPGVEVYEDQELNNRRK